LDARQHVLIPAKTILPFSLGPERFKPESQKNGSDLDRLLLFLHIEIDRTRAADFYTLLAPDACFWINDKTVWDCLSIRKVNGLSFLQTSPELPLHLYRANFDAGLAEGATVRVDEARFSNDGDFKIASFSFNL
jgi:hypothetical protein